MIPRKDRICTHTFGSDPRVAHHRIISMFWLNVDAHAYGHVGAPFSSGGMLLTHALGSEALEEFYNHTVGVAEVDPLVVAYFVESGRADELNSLFAKVRIRLINIRNV